MGTATSDRIPWADVPPDVRDAIAGVVGGAVVDVHEQATGFSPGFAARVGTADGRRAFVKAAPRSLGAAAGLYRREADVLTRLPDGVSAPALMGTADAGEWFALVTDEVAGAHPTEPPTDAELNAVLDVVAAAPEAAASGLPLLTEELGFGSWAALAADHPRALRAEERRNAAALAALADEAAGLLGGDRLVHLDTRADNVLFDASGRVWLVDWAWGCVGAPWIDGLTMLLVARYDGRTDADRFLRHPAFDGVAARAVDALLAGLAGEFRANSLKPAPPRMPALRGFQAAQADAAIDWLAERGTIG